MEQNIEESMQEMPDMAKNVQPEQSSINKNELCLKNEIRE